MDTTNNKKSPATADLCDEHISSPQRLCIAEPCIFQSYGQISSFHGQIETIRCFESNPLVRETVSETGQNRVLVVDGGGSKRCAILGKEHNGRCAIIMHSNLLSYIIFDRLR